MKRTKKRNEKIMELAAAAFVITKTKTNLQQCKNSSRSSSIKTVKQNKKKALMVRITAWHPLLHYLHLLVAVVRLVCTHA